MSLMPYCSPFQSLATNQSESVSHHKDFQVYLFLLFGPNLILDLKEKNINDAGINVASLEIKEGLEDVGSTEVASSQEKEDKMRPLGRESPAVREDYRRSSQRDWVSHKGY